MSVTFTESIRSLIEQGGDPDPDTFETLLESLRGALMYELRKRGLFTSSPSYLGIYGVDSWRRGDALEELLADCFLFAVAKRLERLEHHLKVKSNIDGLIFANIRYFLSQVQQKHDRVGFTVFKALHQAIRRSIAAGVLHVLEGHPEVRNDTVLGFTATANPGRAHGVTLSEHVADWADDLLPDLLTAKGKKRGAILGRLQSHLEELRDQDVEVFQFKTLIDPFQNDVRQRWSAMGGPAGEELAVEEAGDEGWRLVRLVRPETGAEERDSFRALLACIGESIDKLDARRKTKEYLLRLWSYLRSFAVEESDDKLPANQQLAQRLGIPRDRFPELYSTLAGLVEACRIGSSGNSSIKRQKGALDAGAVPGGATAMNQVDHRERLRGELSDALSRMVKQRAAPALRGDGPPKVGEVFLFVATAGFPVEWAVVEEDSEEPGFFWVVATDAQPLVGSADVEVPARASWGAMSLRCGCGVRLPAAAFDRELCVGRLESDDLALVRRKRDEIARGSPTATEEVLTVDDDPEYQDWRGEVLARAQAALTVKADQAAGQPGGKVIAFPSRRWRSLAVPLAAAASILVAITLGFELVSQRRQPLSGLHPTWFTTLQDVRGGQKAITIPSTAEYVLLMVDVNDPNPYPAYRLEVGERQTEFHWKSDELPRAGVEDLSAALPRRWLPAGEYPFRIYGVREGQEELVVEYTLQVEVE